MIAPWGVFHVTPLRMMETVPSPFHTLPSGLCEDASGEACGLIQRMAAGDGAALAEIHAMWCPVLLGSACRMLGDRREAEELVLRTFERLWKRAVHYDPHQMPPFVWAFITMRELAIDCLRGRRHGKRDAPRDPVFPASARNEGAKALAADDCRRLRSAMDQLDLEERSCLERAVFLEFAHPAATEHAGGTPATVKNHLRRALENICTNLSRHEL